MNIKYRCKKYNVFFVSIFICSFCLGIFACKKDGENSELEVSRGKVIDYNEYPGIIQLESRKIEPAYDSFGGTIESKEHCTGAIISSNTILTAAHCVAVPYSSNVTVKHYYLPDINANWFNNSIELAKRNPKFAGIYDIMDTVDVENSKLDIGIMVVNNGVFKNRSGKLQISDIEPKVNDKVRMVGFGCYTKLETTKSDDGNILYKMVCDEGKIENLIKRTGTNTISDVTEDESYVKLYATSDTVDEIAGEQQKVTGEKVQAAHGDSGGPLLLESSQTKILGVASHVVASARTQKYCEDKYGKLTDKNKSNIEECMFFGSYYANPVSSYNMSFLENMVDNHKAIIPGIQVGVRVIEYNGKVKILYKEEQTSFSENVEEYKVVNKFNNNSYNSVEALKKAWRGTDFYQRSKASWSFE